MLLNLIALPLLSVSLTVAQAGQHRQRLNAVNPRAFVKSSIKSSAEYLRLIKQLRSAGANVKLTNERVRQPFFSVAGRVLTINDETLQVFNYRNVSAADAQAKHVAPDGMMIGTSKPSWMAPPHFFKKGRLIVLYVGASESILAILRATLGAQFAGS